MKKLLALLLLTLSILGCTQKKGNQAKIDWQEFGLELFEQAELSNKYIILDLKANWCHWCHVMDDSTYSSEKVIAKLNESFLAVKTDQDANPELANRYRKYGWPATIIFSPKGEEVFKNAGYINPQKFLAILEQISNGEKIDEQKKRTKTYPNSSPQALLKKRYINGLDFIIGGANSNMKSINFSDYEYATNHSSDSLLNWINLSIKGASQLVDPEFGGIYQYSTFRRWDHQHYEKLLSRQARYIKIFCIDYQLYQRQKSLENALAIYKYTNNTLKGRKPLFFSAQDADLIPGEHSEDYFKLSKKERLKKGIPKIDTNTYTNYNAHMIDALIALWVSTQKVEFLDQAELNYNDLKQSRKGANLLYSHTSINSETYALDDNLKMLKANFELYKCTQNQIYFEEARNMIDTIIKLYQQNDLAISYLKNNGLPPKPIIDENIDWCRLLNYAGYLYSDSTYSNLSKRIHRALMEKVLAGDIYKDGELLTIDEEINEEPLHAVILYENETYRQQAVQASLSLLPFSIIIESYPISAVPDRIADRYGDWKTNTTFFCTSYSCSAPLTNIKAIKNYAIQ
ncbi:MAG: DUF255 domain-containing protein [Crocinitomicaceae bacterium]